MVLSKVFVLWLLLKMLRSKVLASFADRYYLPCFLTSSCWTEETVIGSFQHEECVQLAIVPITQLTHSTLADKLLSFLRVYLLIWHA